MATLAAMNEKPTAPPFLQYHVPPRPHRPDPVARGIKMGITTAALLGIGYALLVPIWLHLLGNGPTITPLEIRDMGDMLGTMFGLYTWYGVLGWLVLLLGWAIGGMGGAFGGAIIGYIVREWLLFRPTRRARVGWGLGVSLLFTLPLWLVGELLLGGSGSTLRTDSWVQMVWYAPLALAFVGAWWVTYRLLEQEHV